MSCTNNICGEWEDVTDGDRDQGRCFPYRVKKTCAKPDTPETQCPGETFTTVYDPDNTAAPFYVTSQLRDEDCNIVTDENGDPIETVTA